MLVLTRKKGQAINIGDNIRVVVLDVAGDTVRVGVEAPAEVSVHRGEIYRAIQEENRAAVASRNMAEEIKAAASRGVVPVIEDPAKPAEESNCRDQENNNNKICLTPKP